MDRIATYLDEEEVDEQVSTLKKSALAFAEDTTKGLGIEHGTFKWNEVEQPTEAPKKSASSSSSNGTSAGDDDAVTAVDSASVAGSDAERRFELADINVMFPEGELTVVTGPTASGKTALLVSTPMRHKDRRGSRASEDGITGRNDACRGSADNVQEPCKSGRA
jgi:ABC-type ATPase with predicted acetyltransferase domain